MKYVHGTCRLEKILYILRLLRKTFYWQILEVKSFQFVNSDNILLHFSI